MAFKLQLVTSNFSNDFIFYTSHQVVEGAKLLLHVECGSGAVTILKALWSEQ